MWPMILALAAQKMKADQQKRQMGREAQADIGAQRAGQLGYPTYGVQAAKTEAAMDDVQGPAYIAELIKLQQQRRGGRGDR